MSALPPRFALGFFVILVCSLSFQPGFGQKLVDPNSVAPEFRASAERRLVEQIKLNECAKKADQAKVLRRDKAAFINRCLEN
jgi:hypothetical protein